MSEIEQKAVRGSRVLRVGVWALVVLCAVSVAGIALSPDRRAAARLARVERNGDLHFQAGRGGEAKGCWQRVLAAAPGDTTARNKLAVACMQEGRFEDARAFLSEGLRLAPDEVSHHYNLGLVLAMEGKSREALGVLDRVLEMYPDHGNVHYLRGVLLERLGEPDRAKQEFVRALNVDPATPEAWVKLGVLAPGAGIRRNARIFGEE